MWFFISKKMYFYSTNGVLAQLARVLDWQSRGHGFDSRTLHKLKFVTIQVVSKRRRQEAVAVGSGSRQRALGSQKRND